MGHTGGEVGDLRRMLRNVPAAQARVVREVAQKEYENDVKAHDALVVRGNMMLSASAVALSLLVGLSKETVVDTCLEQTLLVLALTAATLAVLLVVLSMRLFEAGIVMQSATIAGDVVTESSDIALWQRDHEVVLALAYFEIRLELARRHRRRARLLAAAQWTYLVFLALVCSLGLAIPL